jgi:hypothetical protein
MFWIVLEDEQTETTSSSDLSLELESNSNVDELVMSAYGCELSWRGADVACMVVAPLRG